ncbi:hypothetical protein C0Z19_25505 [Trinickia soli]|uniref:Uncharacterized protein n=1 Tax=Trinickia soli TaxID=380675 RepID=A0A2N7VI00_9BURK|nr:hypothetical protein C0Z19_25505 [Trinickia soli]
MADAFAAFVILAAAAEVRAAPDLAGFLPASLAALAALLETLLVASLETFFWRADVATALALTTPLRAGRAACSRWLEREAPALLAPALPPTPLAAAFAPSVFAVAAFAIAAFTIALSPLPQRLCCEKTN